VLLVLATASPAPPGFANVGDDRWISSVGLDELEGFGAHAEMPAPTLTPVGTTADDAELLVELEASAVITIGGPRDEATRLLRAMALAAATSPWSEQSRVLAVGLEGEMIDQPWVAVADHFADALTEAEAQIDRIMSSLWSMRCQSTGQARASGVTPEAWAPLVVMSATPPGELGERQRLATLASRPRTGVAFVTVATPGVAPVGRAFTIGEDGWLRIDGIDVEVRPDRLDAADSGVLTELLDVAARRDVARDGAPDPPVRRPPPAVAVAGSPPDSGLPAARRLTDLMAGVDVLIRVLGEVEAVRVTDPPVEERLVPIRQKGLEALVYMALREVPVDREELEARLFPDGANAAKTVYNTISAARGLVGEDLFPAPADGHYRLSDTVVTDYGLFSELVAQANDTEDPAVAATLLTDALSLVRTEPFMGVGRNYAWVGAHRGMIVAQVIDTAEELAEMHLARDDWRQAEWAARRGLRAFPADERLHRVLMRTARAAGNIPGVQRVFRELCEAVADPDLGVEPEDTLHPETIALLEELTGSASRRGEMGA
jgi:DNA-binding SARP family transcriptional activator